MTEAEARAWLTSELHVTRETLEQIEAFLGMLRAEMANQNLIAEASWPDVWSRHVVDSAQLLRFAPRDDTGLWMDMGSGAGFPGIIIAILRRAPMLLVESRRKRVEFLQNCTNSLNLAGHTEIAGSRLELLESRPCSVISARAFAPMPKLLSLSARFSTEKTTWLLPKGRNAAGELEQIKPSWAKLFHVEQSVTDTDAGILVGRGRGKPFRTEKKS